MKFIYTLISGLSLYILVSCSSSSSIDYEKSADNLSHRVAKRLETTKNLHLIGIGGGMMDDIKMMSMSFQYYHEVDIKTARALIVYVVNEYLKEINNDTQIKSFLHQYPFTPENIEIAIFVYKPDQSYPPEDKIQCFSAINGNVTYFLHEPNQPYKPIHKENFEEAVRLLEKTNNL